MKRYSQQVKLVVVQAYRSGELGWKATAKIHDVEPSSLRKWVAAYAVHGIDGVQEKRRERISDFPSHRQSYVICLRVRQFSRPIAAVLDLAATRARIR